jgi:hypothetical protein
MLCFVLFSSVYVRETSEYTGSEKYADFLFCTVISKTVAFMGEKINI